MEENFYYFEDNVDHLSDIATGHRILLDEYNQPHMCLHMAALFLFLTGLCFCCFKIYFGVRRVRVHNENIYQKAKFMQKFEKSNNNLEKDRKILL